MSSRSTRFRIAVASLAALLAVGYGPVAGPAGAQTPSGAISTDAFCAAAPDTDPFSDVADNDSNIADIRCLVASGITVGLTATTYGPAASVSRRQMALFIKRLIDKANELEVADLAALPAYDGTPDFPDTNNEPPQFEEAIGQLVQAGIVDGKDDGTYGPGETVKRDQMAKFIAGALGFLLGDPLPDGPDAFTDDTGVFETDINRLARAGIVVGVTPGTYGPRLDVTRRQMASFLIRGLSALLAIGAIDELDVTGDGPITVDDTTIEQGGTVAGSVADPDDVDTVTVDGCGLTDEDVTVADDGTFSFDLPATQAVGECTLTFTVTFADGTTVDQEVDITVEERPGNATTTSRPELFNAAIVGTTEAGEVTPGNPLGTSVRYTFDEDVDGVVARFGEFMVYGDDGAFVDAGDAIASQDGADVVVRFSALATDESAADLTLATVDFDAVTDEQGQVNPEGDAPIGTAESVVGAAGVTGAPDLLSIGGFRQGATVGITAIDFTFDQPAFQDSTLTPSATDPTGYQLVLPNGAVVVCSGPVDIVDDGVPSGGTSAGGNGTAVHTVECPNQATTVANPNGTLFSAANIARGVLDYDSHTVETRDQPADGTPTNTQQTVDVAGSGNTADPDLVSAEFRPGATPVAVDQVLFVFDESIATANPGSFYVYDESAGLGTPGVAAMINPALRTQVLVDFPAGTLDDAVGAYIDGDDSNMFNGGLPAVRAQDNNAANAQDEVGVADPTPDDRVPGETAAPQLVSVALAQPDDPFGNPDDFEATYTFDEDVELFFTFQYYLYQADGARLQATTCTAGADDATTTDDDDTITCSAYNIVNTPPGTPGAADSDDIGAAVLGTVDEGAVFDDTFTFINPEGAEPTTGGTGTPTT